MSAEQELVVSDVIPQPRGGDHDNEDKNDPQTPKELLENFLVERIINQSEDSFGRDVSIKAFSDSLTQLYYAAQLEVVDSRTTKGLQGIFSHGAAVHDKSIARSRKTEQGYSKTFDEITEGIIPAYLKEMYSSNKGLDFATIAEMTLTGISLDAKNILVGSGIIKEDGRSESGGGEFLLFDKETIGSAVIAARPRGRFSTMPQLVPPEISAQFPANMGKK